MPKFLEEKLKSEYGDNKKAIFGTMNKLGAMKGNKETPKGKAMEVKHEAKLKKKPTAKTATGHTYNFRTQVGKRAPARINHV